MKKVIGGIALLFCWGCGLQPTISSPPSAQPVKTAIPGRLIFKVGGQQHLLVKNGRLQVFKAMKPLAEVVVEQNRFELKPLAEPGPYTYSGQGLIAAIQQNAVPIGGSQGGAVPIGGSQGGIRSIFSLLAETLPAFKTGDTISFSGELNQNLTQTLPNLDIEVPPQNIKVVVVNAQNSIVNVDSNVTNSPQVVVVGNTQGNVNVGQNQAQNMPPVIESAQPTPSLVTAPSQVVTLEVKATDPEGKALSFHWTAERGTLSSDSGSKVTWIALDNKSTLPGIVPVKVTVKDEQGAEQSTIMNIIVQMEKTSG